MFDEFLGLNSNPFENICDPEGALFHEKFNSIYADLLASIHEKQGIILLLGAIGSGKTTVIRRLINDLKVLEKPVLYLDAKSIKRPLPVNSDKQLAMNIRETEQNSDDDSLLDTFNQPDNNLPEQQKNIVVIDHANFLEENDLGLLIAQYSIAETVNHETLLILVGAPELEKIFDSQLLLTFKPAIVKSLHLENLGPEEVALYIDSRLKKTGKTCQDYFSPEVVIRIHAYSHGIPSSINNLCAAALVFSNAENQNSISCSTVDEVAKFCIASNETDIIKTTPTAPENDLLDLETAKDEILSSIEPETVYSDQSFKADIKLPSSDKINTTDNYVAKSSFLIILGCFLGIGFSALYIKYGPYPQTDSLTQLPKQPSQEADTHNAINNKSKQVIETAKPEQQASITANKPTLSDSDLGVEKQPSHTRKPIILTPKEHPNTLEPHTDQPVKLTTAAVKAPAGSITTATQATSKADNGKQVISASIAAEQNSEAIDNLSEDPNNVISSLLKLAATQSKNYLYTSPEGNNALESYRKILAINPNHIEAQEQIKQMKQRYFSRAIRAESKSLWDEAKLNYQKVLRITPNEKSVILKIEALDQKQALLLQLQLLQLTNP